MKFNNGFYIGFGLTFAYFIYQDHRKYATITNRRTNYEINRR